MASWIEKASGIYESTSAQFAFGTWVPGMQTITGRFWAANTPDQGAVAVFEAPGRNFLWSISKENITYAKKIAAALQIVVEILLVDDGGNSHLITLIGPRGRVKKIFAFVGYPLVKEVSDASVDATLAIPEVEDTETRAFSLPEVSDPPARQVRAREPFLSPLTHDTYIEAYQEPESFSSPVMTDCPSCHELSIVYGIPWECPHCGAWIKDVFVPSDDGH